MADERRISAPLLLAVYSAASFSLIALWEFIFPKTFEPLPTFFLKWRFFHAAATYSSTFPAVALAAIAGTFGFGNWGHSGDERFTHDFINSIRTPLITSFVAALMYAALFLLVQPVSLDAIADMTAKGILFRTSAEKASIAIVRENWKEAGGYLNICQQVWANSPETENARDRLQVGLAGMRAQENGASSAPPGRKAGGSHPGVNAATTTTEALELAKKAFSAGRYYDAHWLATLGERLAKPGASEKASATRLATDAWNAISATEPSDANKSAFSLYKRKRDGYAALLAEDWIRAYFIYEELSLTQQNDPDVSRFLKVSAEGIKSISFFANEVGASIGAVDIDVVLSLPRKDGGRDILRVRRLHPFADAAYGEGLELLSFDSGGTLRYGVEASYIKAVPFRIENSVYGSFSGTALIMLALDREDESIQWKPQWTKGSAPGAIGTRLMLDVPYENILLAARARRGVGALSITELDTAAAILPPYGFIAEAFRAEMLRRFSEPFAFLSLSILVLGIAWRTRAPKGTGIGAFLVLGFLPFAFDVLVQSYRLLASTSATLFAVMLPFGAALTATLAMQVGLFIISLFVLAGHRS
ncbi:MAG: hypothetical protein WCT14_07875 [Treponemataceae bacterium]